MSFTIMGFTITTAEQARTLLIVATLKQDHRVAEQCRMVIKHFEGYYAGAGA